jgi:hypothetical protein
MAHWSLTSISEMRNGKLTNLLSCDGAQVDYVASVYVRIHIVPKALNIGRLMTYRGRQTVCEPETKDGIPSMIRGGESVVVMCVDGSHAALIRLPAPPESDRPGRLAVIPFDYLTDRPPRNGER